MTETERLKAEIDALTAERDERRASLPAHSIRPHQMIRIEELEERIDELKARLKAELARLEGAS